MFLDSSFAFSRIIESQRRIANAIDTVDNGIHSCSKIVGTRGDKDRISRSSSTLLKKEELVGNSAFAATTEPLNAIFVGPQHCASEKVGTIDITTSSTQSSNSNRAMLIMMQETTKDDADKHRNGKASDKHRKKSDHMKRGNKETKSIDYDPSLDFKSDLCGIENTLAPEMNSTSQSNEGLELLTPEQCTNYNDLTNTVSGLAAEDERLTTTVDDGPFVLVRLPMVSATKHKKKQRKSSKNLSQYSDKRS